MKPLTRAFSVLLLVGGLSLPAAPADACSICRCGDATFNALGTEVYSKGAFRIALDWDRFEKSQAVAPEEAMARLAPLHAGEAGSEDVVEDRFTATLSYAFADRVNLVARVPYSSRRLTATMPVEEAARVPLHGTVSESTTASGLSDPEIYALVRLWSAPLSPGLGSRAWLSLQAGVKTPWGENEKSVDGVRLDEHAQPGTGSTDVFGGLSGLYLLDERSSLFGSVSYRRTGTSDQGYRYGNLFFANAAYERKIGSVLDAILELNYRTAGKDRVSDDGAVDENTGGAILYVTPRVAVQVAKGLVARIGVQIPAVKNLYGEQTEKAVVSAGLTVLF